MKTRAEVMERPLNIMAFMASTGYVMGNSRQTDAKNEGNDSIGHMTPDTTNNDEQKANTNNWKK